jgi:TPR repeat protein
MRVSRCVVSLSLFGLAASTGHALDANLSPAEAFRSGYEAYKAGDAATALEALGFAAERGHPGALWKLGRMYQTGDLVAEDDRKALELFSRVATEYFDGNPYGPEAPFVADAFVTLGSYYQNGIPGSIEADPGQARRFFDYAASYFGDADAQYSLAIMYRDGQGGDRNVRQAARWFKLAARKGHVGAQAEFGRMLYEGIGIDRRPVEGLMWLSIAQLSSPGDPGIQVLHEQVFSTASEEERRQAIGLAEAWIANSSGGARAASLNQPQLSGGGQAQSRPGMSAAPSAPAASAAQ